jgi:hypothetical protein
VTHWQRLPCQGANVALAVPPVQITGGAAAEKCRNLLLERSSRHWSCKRSLITGISPNAVVSNPRERSSYMNHRLTEVEKIKPPMCIPFLYALVFTEIALVYASPSQGPFRAVSNNHRFYDVQVRHASALKVMACADHNPGSSRRKRKRCREHSTELCMV